MRRRIAIGLALILIALASVALATMIITYYVSVTPTAAKSPVEFEYGADGVSVINVNKTRAAIQAKIIPLVLWVSEDALRIHNVNNTQIRMILRCSSVSDPQGVIKALKIYLIANATEYLAIELGIEGTIIKGESDWYTMGIDATYEVKVITEGQDGIVEGTKATVVLQMEVRPP